MMFLGVPIQGLVIKKYFGCGRPRPPRRRPPPTALAASHLARLARLSPARYQIQRLKLTDERVKLTNEMVQGIRVIKMCAALPARHERLRSFGGS